MDKAGWIRSSCKCIFGMHVLISYENEDIFFSSFFWIPFKAVINSLLRFILQKQLLFMAVGGYILTPTWWWHIYRWKI